MSKDKQRLIDRFKAVQEMGKEQPLPFDFWRFVGNKQRTIGIFGDQLSMGEDYMDLQEVRQAFSKVVAELGGTIKWEK